MPRLAGMSSRKEQGFVVAKIASKKPLSGTKSAASMKTPLKAKSSKRLTKAPAKPPAKAAVVTKPKNRIAAPAPAATKKNHRPAPVEPTRRPTTSGMTGPILAPVPTNDKPRKNAAGFSPKELEHFRDLLLAKRRDILGDMTAMEREALRTSGGSNLSTLPIHMADMGTDNYEQEFTLGLVESERKQLREINNALAKIQNGSFGICEGTGQPINKARLEVQPWARYSIEYAKQMERGGR